jgi:hypothetical protein
MDEKIKVMMIFEMIGRPKEHLTESLKKLIGMLAKEPGVSVINKKINEPSVLEKKKDFFTSFAEVEVEFDKILYLPLLMFKYMPAHVDIISPENVSMSNNEWNEVLNEVIRRLHGYDEVARVLQMQRAQMEKKLKDAGIE